uniref:Uncharacterized protein n=1 Tax=Anguilla anguilla TaxID=7936 RepID=A0A0E9PKH1_ANGAN
MLNLFLFHSYVVMSVFFYIITSLHICTTQNSVCIYIYIHTHV